MKTEHELTMEMKTEIESLNNYFSYREVDPVTICVLCNAVLSGTVGRMYADMESSASLKALLERCYEGTEDQAQIACDELVWEREQWAKISTP